MTENPDGVRRALENFIDRLTTRTPLSASAAA
jgi:hypothetical protein